MRKRSYVGLAIVWMIILVAGVSSAVTLVICGALPVASPSQADMQGDAEAFEERYHRLDQVYALLRDEYYTQLDEDALMLGAVRGMLDAANDPYTFYYTPEEMQEMAKHTSGLYEGVGLLLAGDAQGNLTVLRVFAGSPAYEAGIFSGDIIEKINGVAVSAKTVQLRDEAARMIRDAQSAMVSFTIVRKGETLTIGVLKKTVEIHRVEHTMLGDIGYILIYEFMGEDVSEFRDAVLALKRAGAKALILDLRSNPGGLLSDVVEIADDLLPEGLIVYTKDRGGRKSEYYSDKSALGLPLAVLVDSMSASASEILAGAVQEFKAGTIVGERTFGKGVVQTVIPFRSDGAGIQLTTATYYTQSGKAIHGVGIVPDILVQTTSLYNAPSLAKDPALKAAHDLLANKIAN